MKKTFVAIALLCSLLATHQTIAKVGQVFIRNSSAAPIFVKLSRTNRGNKIIVDQNNRCNLLQVAAGTTANLSGHFELMAGRLNLAVLVSENNDQTLHQNLNSGDNNRAVTGQQRIGNQQMQVAQVTDNSVAGYKISAKGIKWSKRAGNKITLQYRDNTIKALGGKLTTIQSSARSSFGQSVNSIYFVGYQGVCPPPVGILPVVAGRAVPAAPDPAAFPPPPVLPPGAAGRAVPAAPDPAAFPPPPVLPPGAAGGIPAPPPPPPWF